MIDIKNLSYLIGSRVLLDEISVYIASKSKVGIVGANGCGKSTLFRLILKEIMPDGGEINIPNSLKIVSVKQEINDHDVPLLDFVLSADEKLMHLRHLSEVEHDGLKLAEIFEQIDQIDGFNAEVRAATILSGLGFSNDDLQKKLKEFSGGWQIRAAIAATLFAPSDILLLDEPTNHLDFETGLWLRTYLSQLDKTILIISHERDFLNQLCDKILHLPFGKLYSGNYDTFVTTRAMQQQALEKNIEKQEASRKHIQAFIDKFRYKASKAKQAQSRIKMLEKMEALPKLDRDYTVRFSFPNPTQIDRQLISIQNGVAGYGPKIVLKNLNIKIDAGERVALLGANGNGKSTFVKVISDRLKLLNGSIEFAKKINIAYFSQQQSDELDFSRTPYQILSDILENSTEPKVRAQLARFGLTQQKSDTLVRHLSGGEKTRLLLAIITRGGPHILILDEPTNHLDIEAKEALIEAINDYEGAVVLVSHDSHMVESVCDRLLLVANNKCSEFSGDIDDYMKFVLTSKKAEKKSAKKKNSVNPGQFNASKSEMIKKLEKDIAELNKEKLNLERQINDKYSADDWMKIQAIDQELQELETNWLELSQDEAQD